MTRRLHQLTAATLVVTCLSSLAPAPLWAKTPKRGTGYVQVLSITVGAEIYVDGELIGTVPYEDYIPLTAGEHTLEVRRRGYSEFAQSVTVRAGQTEELIVDLIAVDGVVTLKTPGVMDAAVAVDGDIIGSTPFDGLVPAGEHMLEVTAPGYRTFSQKLSIRAGESYELVVDLQPDMQRGSGSIGPAVTGATSAAEGDEDTGSTPVHETWWFWTLIGVGVAGTATALALTLGPEEGGGAPKADWSPSFPPLGP